MAQLSSQFEAVVIDSDFARTLSGKSSPVTTQAHGPHELAKKKMYMHTNAISVLLATCEPGNAVPTDATIIWHTAMPTAPKRRRSRRPDFSTRYRPGSVELTLTT